MKLKLKYRVAKKFLDAIFYDDFSTLTETEKNQISYFLDTIIKRDINFNDIDFYVYTTFKIKQGSKELKKCDICNLFTETVLITITIF